MVCAWRKSTLLLGMVMINRRTGWKLIQIGWDAKQSWDIWVKSLYECISEGNWLSFRNVYVVFSFHLASERCILKSSVHSISALFTAVNPGNTVSLLFHKRFVYSGNPGTLYHCRSISATCWQRVEVIETRSPEIFVQNLRTLKNKYDLTLCQSRLHTSLRNFRPSK